MIYDTIYKIENIVEVELQSQVTPVEVELGKVPFYSLEFHIYVLEPYIYMLSMNC